MSQLHWLDTSDLWFPPSCSALSDPDGLLAVGGDLSPNRLIKAYSLGIFPWYSEGQPLLWWTPDLRMTLAPQHLHIGRSVRKLLRKQHFQIRINTSFETVMRQCGTIDRQHQDGSWINEDMIEAYDQLHKMGIAHSIEAWQHNELVGGLYGVALGRVFFGESMFSLVSGASKATFATLAMQLKMWQFELIDCQIQSDYLASFGATEVSRKLFESQLQQAIKSPPAADTPASCIELDDSDQQLPILDWSRHWQMPEYGYDGSI